tara:strand:+ start:999 stop:1343 length:345 start_codon:yes stop_codon:yes gene_type:complete
MSGRDTGDNYNLESVMSGNMADNVLPHGVILNEFLEAIFAGDTPRLKDAQNRLIEAMGEQALVDAAATIAAFNAYPRMADATGIPLESAKEEATEELRINLGLDVFSLGNNNHY